MNSAKIQFILWLKFRKQEGDEEIMIDRAFNSKITEFFKASDFNKLIEEMFSRIKTQVKNPALPASRFSLDQVLHLHIDFHKLNLTRGSSYIALPDWISKKKAGINPKNEDQECFKLAVTVVLNHGEISNHPERISNIKPYTNNYNWTRLEFLVAVNKINRSEKYNPSIAVNVLAIGKGKELYVCRRSKHFNREQAVNLLLLEDKEKRHYVAIKKLSRLLGASNSKDGHKQHFCINCLQGFHSEEIRDQHFEFCSDNDAVKVEMPESVSILKFNDGQYQFKVPFIMYADFKSILQPISGCFDNLDNPSNRKINQHVPSGFCVYSKFAYGGSRKSSEAISR